MPAPGRTASATARAGHLSRRHGLYRQLRGRAARGPGPPDHARRVHLRRRLEGGEIDGTGVATYGNGDRYEGTFAAGKRQGQGVMRYATGQIASGEWQDNRLIEADQGSTDAAPTEDAPDLPAEAP
ncbi:hypothetical protein FLP41_19005 [Paracoccus marcusii]|nr:hypothetical protein FLP41_19005 [Paracoccus marcusii]